MRNLSLLALRSNSPFRIPPQHSQRGNFAFFSSFSSISHRFLLSQPTQQIVDVNTKRFYSVHPPPPPPPDDVSKDIKSFLKWYHCKSFQTVPYTNRTRRISYPINIEKWNGEIEFKRFKEELMQNEGKMLLPPTHPDVLKVKIVFDNIISALQRDLKKMGNATSSYNSIGERIWMSLLRRVPPASTSHLDGLDWEVLVVSDPDFSDLGVCFAGGKIAVSHEVVESDILIATIISHEVAHIVARHYGEGLSKMLRISSLISMFGSKHIGQRIISLIPKLPFFRRLETEADYIGLLLVASAGYDPQQVPKVIEMMTKSENFDKGRKRAKALAQAKVMQEALAIYNNVRADHG